MTDKLLFLATEDWFVRSHFSHLVERAAADGFEVVVAARMGEARADLKACGARTIDLPHARGENSLPALLETIVATRALLAAERPALVHAIALKPVATLCYAADAGGATPILAVTGRGHLSTAGSTGAGLARWAIRSSIARLTRAGRAFLLVENRDDLDWVAAGRPLPEDHCAVLPGAGVDPLVFAAADEPEGAQTTTEQPGVRIGVVSRLVRSKGVDLVVDAFKSVRAEHPDAELWIAGDADPDNPSSAPRAQLDGWRAEPGVRLLGHITDVPGFWKNVHIACLASRGGEGLPRSLIEAASCARPIVTTDVPGCRDIAIDGVNALVTPPEDAPALARALKALISDRARRSALGKAGRALVLEKYTCAHVADLASDVWRRALSERLPQASQHRARVEALRS